MAWAGLDNEAPTTALALTALASLGDGLAARLAGIAAKLGALLLAALCMLWQTIHESVRTR